MQRNSLDIAQLSATDNTLTFGNDLMLSDNLDSCRANQRSVIPDGLQQKISSPFRVGFTTFLLCVSGEYKIRINLIDYEFRSNMLLIIPEGSISEYPLMDFGAGLLMIAFSQKLSPVENLMLPSVRKTDSVFAIRSISLTPGETQAICSIYNIMRSRLESPAFLAKIELAKSAIAMALNFISPYIIDPVEQTPAKSPGQVTFIRFMQLLDKYCTSHHDLGFYASQLAMSPRNLSRVVIRMSGRSAKDWITERLILEAKAQLNISRQTILQISEQLGFPNQSFFGSFFRRATGMSPMAYRSQSHSVR